jgi:uncharacterized protein YdeI (YjbR/CyaY-like superfamily)
MNTEEIFCKNINELHDWLESNYKREVGIWLVFLKGKERKFSWDEIVEELLCFGWIDGRAKSVDGTKSKIWISPRNPKSGWSAKNKIHIEKLIKEGRMHESGKLVLQNAKESGSWNLLDSIENLEVPEDLNQKLKEFPEAYENFANFPKSAKRATLQWIESARTQKTRNIRITKTAELASKNIRAI